MDQTTRLLHLLALLASGRRWPAALLAERGDVTVRTVRRDVEHLRAMGYAIAAAPGPGGGYRLGAGARVPPLVLDDEEAVAVAVAVRVAVNDGVAGATETLATALSKLETTMPPRVRARVRTVASTVEILHEQAGDVDPAVLLEAATACREDRVLRITYTDRTGHDTTRSIEPFGIVHAARRWYLTAWDRDRTDWRTFRIDRIASARVAGIAIERDPPDARELVSRALSIGPYRHVASVVLHAPITAVAPHVPPTVGQLEDLHGRTRLVTGGDDLSWIAANLAALPFPFEVEAPDGLAAAVTRLADNLAVHRSGPPA